MKHLEVLARAREAARGRMTETVTAGEMKWETHPDTLDPIRVPVSEAYAGEARLYDPSLTVSAQDGAAQPILSQSPALSIPAESEVLPEGTEVVCTASEADSRLVGRRYKTNGTPQMGQTSSHRYPLEVLS